MLIFVTESPRQKVARRHSFCRATGSAASIGCSAEAGTGDQWQRERPAYGGAFDT